MPVGMRGVRSTSTVPRRAAEPAAMAEMRLFELFDVDVESTSSTMLSQAPHPGQRPTHLGVECPQLEQR